MKLEFSVQTSEKFYIKFNENLSTGHGVVLCGRKDGRTERQPDRER